MVYFFLHSAKRCCTTVNAGPLFGGIVTPYEGGGWHTMVQMSIHDLMEYTVLIVYIVITLAKQER
jgi:hypothetical protein